MIKSKLTIHLKMWINLTDTFKKNTKKCTYFVNPNSEIHVGAFKKKQKENKKTSDSDYPGGRITTSF